MEYDYFENGVAMNLAFTGLNYGPTPCSIESSDLEPITGNEPIFSTNITQDYGGTLIMEPIPLEFLSTNVSSPQVLVSINGLNAVCPGFNCDYLY